jgi:tetratricopeptide (TPR) repeat protein
MSLLIKALDKAQSAKQNPSSPKPADADVALSLSPTQSATQSTSNNTNTSQASSQTSAQAKSAANVFASKRIAPLNDNKSVVVVLGLGALALLGLGAYYYVQLTNIPDTGASLPVTQAAMQAPPAATLAEPTVAEPSIVEPTVAAPATIPTLPVPTAANAVLPVEQVAAESANLAAPADMLEPVDMPEPQAFALKELRQLAENKKKSSKKISKDSALPAPVLDDLDEMTATDNTTEKATQSTLDANEQVITPTPAKKSARLKNNRASRAIASDSASIQVSKSQPQSNLNPTLMSAYEAYNAGNDSKSQALYKQVLRNDVRNVDALLGMGAIAQRQGRAADANGWYGKVLEVEPRNSIAQTALLDSRAPGGVSSDPQNDETRLKNMLAKQPDDANLHAALGSLYADQNQWPAAQQAYFDAYRLHASADNAFNLAVSLDQMGKPKLALPYYQRALEQASQTGSSIDKAALEARIQAIR